MAYCTNCGAEAQVSDRFCGNCGKALGSQASADQSPAHIQATPSVAAPTAQASATIISIERIVLMTMVSYGLYLFYWFYITWKQYRDHTGKRVYPFWHAAALSVPIYDLFRVHAHVRAFKELAAESGVLTSLSPGMAVAGVLAVDVLRAASSLLSFAQEIASALGIKTGGAGATPALLDILSMAIVAVVLVHVQSNLNAYWRSVKGAAASSVKISLAEVILGVIGAIAWLTTIVSLAGMA